MSLVSEVAAVRAMYVDAAVGGWINRHNGAVTDAEIRAYENARYKWWRETFPTLNALLVPHIPAGESS